MQIIQTDRAPAAIGPYSQAICTGGMVYTSGQIPLDPATGAAPEGVEAQSRQALENLAAVLAAAGAGLDRVVKTTCFLADMGDFAVFNQVYAEYFRAPCPARSCVAVKTLPKGLLVEVEAVAALSE
ncbi:Rid family detoxifying hydrolase [Allofournierella sp.]|uniref:Rid family detoxifying hydrolase n=1 Tax=Allofournierella sp. TaxID=1940256 RepID=UPI0015B22F7D|nr:endoribonuclease L-PSP [Oscillospiraceae bacterium]